MSFMCDKILEDIRRYVTDLFLQNKNQLKDP